MCLRRIVFVAALLMGLCLSGCATHAIEDDQTNINWNDKQEVEEHRKELMRDTLSDSLDEKAFEIIYESSKKEYTEDSFNAFTKARERARLVLDDPYATFDDLEQALDDVSKAREGLVKNKHGSKFEKE